MKFGNKKVLATIVAVAVATGFTGCSKDENSSVQSDSDTEKDLLTSSSSIDVSTESAQESIDSSLNSHDTSKPIEPTSSLTDGTSSDLTDGGDSSLTGETSDNGTSSNDGDSTGETSSSTGETSKPSDNTTSVPSDSSNSSLTDGTSDSNSSSSSNDAGIFDLSKTEVTKQQYFDKDGNPLPDDFDLSKGGFYNSRGDYTMTPEEYAEYVAMCNKAYEAIDNGTYNIADTMTDEQLADFWDF